MFHLGWNGGVAMGVTALAMVQVACLSPLESSPTVRRNPGELRWMHTIDGAGAGDRALGVAWAEDGIVAVGTTANADRDPNLWMAKHDRDGEQQWERVVDPGRSKKLFAAAVAVDLGGDFVVCGALTDEDDDRNIWVAKVDPTGTLRWQSTWGGRFGGSDEAIGIDVAPSGEIAVVGYEQTGEGDALAWLVMVDGQGERLWQATYDSEVVGFDVAMEVAFAPDGDILVAGYDNLAPYGQETAGAVRRFSPRGELRWRWTSVGQAAAGSLDWSTSIDVADNGDAVAAGWMAVDQETTDVWVVRLDPMGRVLWQRRHTGTDGRADQANDVTIDDAGDVVVAGIESFEGEGFDIWVRKLTGEGIELWTYRHRGDNRGDDAAMAVTTDPFGNVYAGGSVFIDRWESVDDEGHAYFEYDYDVWLASLAR